MSELIVSRQQRVLLLTLNRPAARNALNNALLMQLVNELEAAATDTSISVCVITGNARFFAAGADLNEMAEKDLAATLNDTRPQLWARLQAFNKPLIAAVNGYALGAGCELALLCDVVVAGDAIAVAGFAESELEITAQDNLLVVKGAHADEQKERTYLYQGIAERNFERKFQLAENIHVRGANLVNGLLYIDLERVIPEAKKPRRIEIN